MKISVMSTGFRKGFVGGVRAAKAIGADGIQMYAGEAAMDFNHEPVKPCADGIRTFVDNVGLEISAVCVDGVGGFVCPEEELADRILRSKNMILLANMLGVSNVTSHIGKVPECKCDPTFKQLQYALSEIGAYCANLGMVYCIETGPEKAVVLKTLLDEVNSAGVGVNLDPANLVMCSDDDPVGAVHTLGKYIHHTHAKDGICLWRPVHKEWADVPEDRKWIEVPLGKGEVDFHAWIKALREEGYDGFLAIERECGDDPTGDIKTALDFLRTQI